MNDEDLIAELRRRSTETLLSGAILEHWWLGYSAEDMTAHAGSWQVRITVDELEQLLDMAAAKRWWYEGDSLNY